MKVVKVTRRKVAKKVVKRKVLGVPVAFTPKVNRPYPAGQTDPKLTLRDALSLIGEWLNTPIGADLWSVMSALRGPDSGDEVLKYQTTGVIRAQAFGQRPHGIGFLTWNPISTSIHCPEAPYSHFNSHIQYAAHALGVKVTP